MRIGKETRQYVDTLEGCLIAELTRVMKNSVMNWGEGGCTAI